MTLQGSQRRGFRRRMLQSGGAAGQEPADVVEQPRHTRATPYSKEARPENHPALATWLPTRPLHLWAACVGVLLPIAGLVTAATTTHRWLPPSGNGRWGHAIALVRECLSVTPREGLAAWLGQFSLVAAACVAVSIRQMRRHRLDDYRGRYRAWGWLAGLAAVATLQRQLPLSELFSATVADATGIVLGPEAAGWWLCLSVPACLAAALWAVLPMHERITTGLALAATGLAWAGAAACSWIARVGGPVSLETLAGCLTVAGDGLMAVSMLIAARSVLREVRGEAAKPAQPKVEPRKNERPEPGPTATTPVEPVTAWSDGSDLEEEEGDGWDENATRKLSKAERKRLRKLGRMNRAA